MRSKLLFLTLLAAAVLLASNVHANMLANSGFETGTWTSQADMPDEWWKWGDGTTDWMSGDTAEGTAHKGDKFIFLDGTAWSAEVAQSVMTPVVAGKEYYWGVFQKDASTVAGGGDPPGNAGQYDLHIRWYSDAPSSGNANDNTELQRDEYWDVIDLDDNGQAYGTGNNHSGSYETAPLEWTRFVIGPFIAPATATHVTPVVINWYADWTTWATGAGVLLDDMYFGPYPYPDKPVYGPDPADEAEGIPPDIDPNTTTLSWQKSYFVGISPKVELYWGEAGDPNFWIQNPLKVMDLADVNQFDLKDALGGQINTEPDGLYYWALKYEDPNIIDDVANWGAPALLQGDIWSFDTINRPPTVDAGLHHDRWQNSASDDISIEFDASYTDDGLPIGGNLTYTWSETLSGGATVPSYDSRNIQDPTVTFSSAGNYILKLTIHDDQGGDQDKAGEATVLIRIIANSENRLRAHYELNGNVLDSEENHDGTLNDNPTYGTGQVGLAIDLDGTDDVGDDGLNDSVQIDDTGSDPNFQADTWENSDLIDGMTVSAWMKLDADGWSKNWEAIVTKNNSSWELGRNGSNDTVRFVVQAGIGEATSSGGTDVESGWHQIVGVYDRNSIIIYVDGLEAGSGDANPLNLEENIYNTQKWQIPKAAGKIHIGASSNVTGDLAFAGLIDQVRIFDAAVPKWAHEAGTPGIVEMYRTDGGHVSCDGYMEADVNEDCYITLADFALVAKDWLECNDEANALCD